MKKLDELYKKTYNNEEEFKNLTVGEKILVRLYDEVVNKNYYKNRTTDLIVIGSDVIWEKDYDTFLMALNNYGIKQLVFASTWSSSLEFLTYLLEHGYKVDKPIVYEMEEWLENVTKRKGIKLIKE